MIFDSLFADHTFLVPPQTSNDKLDSGLAILLSVLTGYKVQVSQSEILETRDADDLATTLTDIAQVANTYGLRVQPSMMPVADILFSSSRDLPCILSWESDGKGPNFSLLWNQTGAYLQVMDPRAGRQWHRAESYLANIASDPIRMPANDWWDWAKENGFSKLVRKRLKHLRIQPEQIENLMEEALNDENWYPLAVLDAASRLVMTLVQTRAFDKADEAYQLVHHYFRQALKEAPETQEAIPAKHWVVHRAVEDNADEEEMLHYEALSVLQILEYVPETATREVSPQPADDVQAKRPPSRHNLMTYLRMDNFTVVIIAVVATILASLGVFLEALLFRGFIELGEYLSSEQRYFAIGILLLFGIILLLLYWPVDIAFAHMGRGLAARLRIAALKILPGLSSQYFQDFSDAGIAERVHGVQHTHFLPSLSSRIIWLATKIALTIVGIAWIDWLSASIAIVRSVALLGLFMASRSVLSSQNVNVYIALEKLGRTSLDAMRGLFAIRTHGAERAVRREYEGHLGEWHEQAMSLRWYETLVDVTNRVISYSLMILLMVLYAYRRDEPANLILLFYWSLALDTLAFQLVLMIFMYFRDTTGSALQTRTSGVTVRLSGVEALFST